MLRLVSFAFVLFLAAESSPAPNAGSGVVDVRLSLRGSVTSFRVGGFINEVEAVASNRPSIAQLVVDNNDNKLVVPFTFSGTLSDQVVAVRVLELYVKRNETATFGSLPLFSSGALEYSTLNVEPDAEPPSGAVDGPVATGADKSDDGSATGSVVILALLIAIVAVAVAGVALAVAYYIWRRGSLSARKTGPSAALGSGEALDVKNKEWLEAHDLRLLAKGAVDLSDRVAQLTERAERAEEAAANAERVAAEATNRTATAAMDLDDAAQQIATDVNVSRAVTAQTVVEHGRMLTDVERSLKLLRAEVEAGGAPGTRVMLKAPLYGGVHGQVSNGGGDFELKDVDDSDAEGREVTTAGPVVAQGASGPLSSDLQGRGVGASGAHYYGQGGRPMPPPQREPRGGGAGGGGPASVGAVPVADHLLDKHKDNRSAIDCAALGFAPACYAAIPKDRWTYLHNGDVVKGTYVDGALQGFAKVVYANTKNRYEGSFLDDVRHGEGTFFDNEAQSVFSGQWEHGRKKKGVYSAANGDKYDGEFGVQGRFEGQGTFTHACGDTYTGQWMDDHMDGFGTYKVQGHTCVGTWLRGRLHGTGSITYPDGALYRGTFAYGLRDGVGELVEKDGSKYDGQWESDLRHGTGTITTIDRQVIRGVFYRGVLQSEQAVVVPGAGSSSPLRSPALRETTVAPYGAARATMIEADGGVAARGYTASDSPSRPVTGAQSTWPPPPQHKSSPYRLGTAQSDWTSVTM